MWLSGSVKEMVITNSDTSPLHFQAYIAHFNSRKRMGGQHAAALFSNGKIHMSLCPAAWRIAISRRASWQERWHKQGKRYTSHEAATTRLKSL